MADSSPLILLAKAELIERFLDSFPGPVVIPSAVRAECCGRKAVFDAQLIARLIGERRIEVRKVTDRKALGLLRREFRLGIGEAQSIALARAGNASLIAIEDRNGVNACKILRLPFTGALGILMRLREKDLMARAESLRKLDILQKHGRYRAEIVDDVRRRLEAMK